MFVSFVFFITALTVQTANSSDFELQIRPLSAIDKQYMVQQRAAIEALASLPDNSQVTLVTDSNYVKDGMTSWLANWKKRGWKTAAKKPVKNVDLWQALDAQCQRHQVEWQWVKGHSGHPGNERADELARIGMARYL